MKQREVAQALYIPLRTYQNYERGINSPDIDLICSLADLFAVSVDELVGHEASGKDKDEDALALEETELLEDFRALTDEGRKLVRDLERMLLTSDRFHGEYSA